MRYIIVKQEKDTTWCEVFTTKKEAMEDITRVNKDIIEISMSKYNTNKELDMYEAHIIHMYDPKAVHYDIDKILSGAEMIVNGAPGIPYELWRKKVNNHA